MILLGKSTNLPCCLQRRLRNPLMRCGRQLHQWDSSCLELIELYLQMSLRIEEGRMVPWCLEIPLCVPSCSVKSNTKDWSNSLLCPFWLCCRRAQLDNECLITIGIMNNAEIIVCLEGYISLLLLNFVSGYIEKWIYRKIIYNIHCHGSYCEDQNSP